MLHWQLGPSHDFLYSLNFVINLSDFIFAGSLFHILIPNYDIMWSDFCVCFWSEIFFHM